MIIVHGPAPFRAPVPPVARRRTGMRVLVALFAVIALGLLAFAMWVATDDPTSGAESARRQLSGKIFSFPIARVDDAVAQIAATAVAKENLRSISAEEAIAENARIPVADGENPAARPLVVPLGDGSNYLRALDCLTSAVYYEAANEPVDGQRAVAQVVLNRVRHVAYPHSVCGVVYQGSDRKSGCQFSFTCDGSLVRMPSPALWQRARAVASAALSGLVYAPVGLATHYHADYVLPYWASSLLKQKVIGRHIFYRWPNIWGKPGSFLARYQPQEPASMGVASLQASLDQKGWLASGSAAEPLVSSEVRPVIMGSAPPVATDARSKQQSLTDRVYLANRSAAPAPEQGRPAGVTGGVIMATRPDTRSHGDPPAASLANK